MMNLEQMDGPLQLEESSLLITESLKNIQRFTRGVILEDDENFCLQR